MDDKHKKVTTEKKIYNFLKKQYKLGKRIKK
jgi:hypothetical protein